jgi:N-methylhydantoinase A
MGMRVAVDIGGTFTDFITVDGEGRVRVYKTSSTPRSPEQAVFKGIEALAQDSGLDVNGFLADVDLFIHGTTIATNTVIQRNGPKIGVVHTQGFPDILFLRDGHKPDRYNLHMPPPDPFVPRYLRLEVDERVLYSGEVHRPLDEESVRRAVGTLRQEGVESVALCLLWSMVNPTHEQRVVEILREELPEAYVAQSAEILPAIREWPRACATTLSAYVGPVLGRYLTKVSSYLSEHGYRYELLIMQVTGGAASVAEIEKRPVLAIGSGPAAGPSAGLRVGSREGEQDLMVVDMGGTSFDVSLISDGAFTMSRELQVEGMPIGVAAVEVHSVGAGGGSIAWIDAGGMLRVGPRSAGADPGPACYGLGGEEPTVTDANVILGYLNPEYFLGGRMRLDRERSERAMERIARPLDLDVVEAAAAVYRIVNTNMVGAMRAVSVMRGVDPRGYTVIVGGGAGGTHAAKIAEELGMRKAICPTVAGGLCAFGMLVADVRQTYLTTYAANTSSLDVARVNAILAEMEQRAAAELQAQGFSAENIVLNRSVDAKYPYQLHEIIVPVPGGELTEEDVPTMAGIFHDHHDRLYNYSMPEMAVDMNGWRVTAVGRLPALPLTRQSAVEGNGAAAGKGARQVFFEEHSDYAETPIYDGERFAPGMVIAGPAVAELATTTVVVFPGHTLSVNAYGDFHIDIPQAAA